MNTDLLAKILETAGHPETPEEEAKSAVRQARALLARNGKSFGDVLGGSVTVVQQVMPTNANVPYAKWVERVAELEAQVRELEKKPKAPSARDTDARVLKAEKEVERLAGLNVKLTAKIDDLTTINRQINSDNNRLARLFKETKARAGEKVTVAETTPSIDVSGEVSFADWAEAVALKLGSSQAWQMAVEEQTLRMGVGKVISRRDIQRWKKRGQVPDLAVQILQEIHVNEADEPPIVWSATKVSQVRSLVDRKMSEMNIATRLSERWGQRVTDNNIKRLKHDSRTKQRLWQERGWGLPMGAARSDKPKPSVMQQAAQAAVRRSGTLHSSENRASQLYAASPDRFGHG